jgi:acyl-coenzyme A thioesterase PaaI-like protein
MNWFNKALMKTIEIPFNKHLEIKSAEEKSDFLLCLNASPKHLNHLGTIHASALFSLAEATSGEFLLSHFKSISKDVIPVVRKAEVKFRKVVNGKISAKAELVGSTKQEVLEELKTKKRALVRVNADIYDKDYLKVFSSVFEWFIIMKT